MAGSGSIPAPRAGRRGRAGSDGALALHVAAGLVWGLVVVSAASAFGSTAAVAWFVSSALLWVLAARELRAPERRRPAGRVVGSWWLQTWLAPLFAGPAVVRLLRAPPAKPEADGVAEPAEGRIVSTPPVYARIAGLERAIEALRPRVAMLQERLDEIARELDELRALDVSPAASEQPSRAPAPEPSQPLPAPPPQVAAPPRPPAPAPRPLPPRAAEPAARAPRDVDLAELLGARALAWAGGVVTLLGVVFFFVLAVDRGWIGPVERVGLGATASALLLAAGIVARRRHGDVYSALAAAGAGIAGGYATLLAAAALYGLVGDLVALLLAAAIAASGAALALAWRAQMLAGIGLVGATLVPLTLIFEGGLSVVGTAFVALVFAATAVVAIRHDWRPLLAVGLGASVLQIWLLILQSGGGAGAVLLLSAVFAALYVAVGISLERAKGGLERLSASLVLLSASVAGLGATVLLGGTVLGADRQGAALLAAAAAYGVCAAVLFPRGRDLSALLGALALALAAVGLAVVLTGNSLAVAWSAQAAVLALLGGRLREPRYRLASLAYLTLAGAYVLAVVAPPAELLSAGEAPAAGVPSVLALALSALVFARYARGWESVSGNGAVARALDTLTGAEASWRLGARLLAPVAAVHALSLLVLGAMGELGVRPAFEWGHVALTAVWAAGGGAALLAGLAFARRPLQLGGLAWLAAALLKTTMFDIGSLPPRQAAWSALVLGLGFAAAGYGVALLRNRSPFDVAALSYAGTALSGLLVLGATAELLPRGGALDPLGSALLAAAAAHALLAATIFARPGRRGPTTAFWATGVALALVSSFLLLDSPTATVAAWSAGAAALALLAAALGERRLLVGAAALASLAVGRTLVELAPPTDLFVPAAGAADGVPALVLALVGALAVVAASARIRRPPEDDVDAAVDLLRDRHRAHAVAGAAVLAVYALSLSILGVAQAVGGGDATTDFQRGHTAVSALWGLIGLFALRFGLTRGHPAPKLAGFALFGVALAKLFLYDLTTLSSVTRALSFLAVGAVLLVAGFFYQRLSGRAAEA